MWETKSYLKKLLHMLKKNLTKQNVQTVLAVGPRKIPEINKRRAFNRAIGSGKKW